MPITQPPSPCTDARRIAAGRSLAPDDLALISLALMAQHAPPGAIVELGVHRGGSAAVLGHYSGRPVWLFDTWAGIPNPGPEHLDGRAAQRLGGSMVADKDECLDFLARANVQVDRAVQGDWRETLTRGLIAEIGPIALLHIDGDWFDSVYAGLHLLVPHVVPGGYVVLDDFGWWEGARRAFYGWCASTGEAPLLERAGRHQASWMVGAEHNRPAPG